MSKLNKELVDKAVETIIQFSNGETITKEGKEIQGKKRKFTESVELQARLRACARRTGLTRADLATPRPVSYRLR